MKQNYNENIETKPIFNLKWYTGRDEYSEGNVEDEIIEMICKEEPENYSVLPFTIGLVVLLGYLCVRYYKWIKSFPKEERKKIRKGLFSFKTIRSGWEIFRESLLHHNIFKTNPMLGYMHMQSAASVSINSS